MNTKRIVIVFAAAVAMVASAGAAFAQNGPVATACAKEIGQYCAGKKHGGGAVRACLEANRAKVSADCKAALDGTGGGRR